MALTAIHSETTFGVGDRIKVIQKIRESGKTRSQTFEGQVVGIKGREENKSFTVRRIGAAQIGIERIYPLASPTIEKIEVVKKGLRGVRRAKLYYTRDKSRREIEAIFSRATKREKVKNRIASETRKIKTKVKKVSKTRKKAVRTENKETPK